MKLTKEETNIILPVVMRMLRTKSSKNNPLYGQRIVDFLNLKKDEIGFRNPMTDTKLRKCINYLRTNGLMPIIADDNGYYVSNDPTVIRDMAASLRRRTAAIEAAASGLEDLANTLDPRPKKDELKEYIKKHNYGRNEDRIMNEFVYVGQNERDLH